MTMLIKKAMTTGAIIPFPATIISPHVYNPTSSIDLLTDTGNSFIAEFA